MINITLPDGSVKEFESGSSSLDVALSISEGLARNVLAAEVNGEIIDATRPLTSDSTVSLLTWNDDNGKMAMWHSSAHLMAEAIEFLYPGVKLAIGPPIEKGFYYDIDLGENHIAYIHISEHKPPVIKALEEVSESISTILKSEKALELVNKEVAAHVEKINAGETTLSEISTELEKTIVSAVDVERIGSKEPFNLVNNVFSLKLIDEKSLTTFVESANNVLAIVELKSIVSADASEISEEDSTTISTQLQRTSSNNEMTTITEILRNDASINVNEAIFEDNQ